MDPRPPQRLVGVDVPDAGDEALVEEPRLHRCAGAGEGRGEDVGVERLLERLGSEGGQRRESAPVAGRDDVDATEATRVAQDQRGPVVELEPDPDVGVGPAGPAGGIVRGEDPEDPRHAEVQHQLRGVRGRSGQGCEQELPPARHRADAAAAGPLDVAESARRVRVACDPDDGAALDERRQLAPDGLDLGQLGHGSAGYGAGATVTLGRDRATSRGGAGGGAVADRDPAAALRSLPARTWALVLRELRSALDASPDGTADRGYGAAAARAELGTLLRGPRSAIAAGPGRDRVAALLAADAELRGDLAARPALADAVAALGVAVEPAADPVAVAAPGATVGGDERDASRLRTELARARRQRDGAEARARSAEARAAAADAEVRAARTAIADLEAALAEAGTERSRAVERAVRRSEDRVRTLEAVVATERAERHRLDGALARSEAEVATLRAEVAALRSAVDDAAVLAAEPDAPPPVRRPVGLPPGVAPDTTEAARHLLAAVDLVVVDGYNLTLRARPGLDLAGQRSWLLGRLRPLVARGLRVVVVFDGDGATGTRRADAGVDVRFTPERRIADDEIEFVVGEATGAVPTLVVTDDAELRRRVRAHDADVVAVLPFVGAVG